jgi:hypothetical protein
MNAAVSGAVVAAVFRALAGGAITSTRVVECVMTQTQKVYTETHLAQRLN